MCSENQRAVPPGRRRALRRKKSGPRYPTTRGLYRSFPGLKNSGLTTVGFWGERSKPSRMYRASVALTPRPPLRLSRIIDCHSSHCGHRVRLLSQLPTFSANKLHYLHPFSSTVLTGLHFPLSGRSMSIDLANSCVVDGAQQNRYVNIHGWPGFRGTHGRGLEGERNGHSNRLFQRLRRTASTRLQL